MLKIITAGEALDLPDGFSIDIEDSNPVFNDRGSQSWPVTIPATLRNNVLLGWPQRFDSALDEGALMRTALISDGTYLRTGVLNVTDADESAGISFNLGFDNSTAYAKWAQKKLTELRGLPVVRPEDFGGQGVLDLLNELHSVYMGTNGESLDDLAVFPVAINNESEGSGDTQRVFWEILNVTGTRGLDQPSSVKRLINGKPTDVSLPVGYGVSPFLRVWRVIELIFSDLGLSVENNPFKSDPDLRRLVVLNNIADAVCPGYLRYSDLMPDATVDEFLNSLWVRFGLVYDIKYDRATVVLRFIRDIVDVENARSVDSDLMSRAKIIFETPKYIKLSAKTSINGASPACCRFEDFTKGLEISGIKMGVDVSSWKNTGTADQPVWDGADYPDRDDRDDPEDPRDDMENNPEFALAFNTSAIGDGIRESFLAREYVTGVWYRLDANNGTPVASSSTFFDWDPQTPGVEPLELASSDEWVPILRVQNTGTGTGWNFNEKCPAYLFGARHYHTFIVGSNNSENNGDTTPLAFMFAYTVNKKTVGRFCPEGEDGKTMRPDDGSFPSLSLLFQFKDGLFSNFWKKYDEITRHSIRSAEIKVRINKAGLFSMNLLDPIKLSGIICLPDTISYSLPARNEVAATIKVRSLLPVGSYDIASEQNIPDFSVGARRLVWRVVSDGFESQKTSYENKSLAARRFITLYRYSEHGSSSDWFYVDEKSAILQTADRVNPTWENDSSLPLPVGYGQKLVKEYSAIATYDIHEIHDLTGGPDEPRREEIMEASIGSVTITIKYQITLVADWAQ